MSSSQRTAAPSKCALLSNTSSTNRSVPSTKPDDEVDRDDADVEPGQALAVTTATSVGLAIVPPENQRARNRTAIPPAGAMSISSASSEVTVRFSIVNSVGAVL
jgi:hypothetical protein